MSDAPKAVVLLSGGLDSTTCMAIAKSQGFDLYAMSFQYGQRHRHELDCAARIAQQMGAVKHHTVTIGLDAFGGSALTANIDVPKGRSTDQMEDEIPVTYVPARNTIFLSFALAWAEVLGASDIFIGVNALDYSGYPDCRPEYIEAFQKMANLATKSSTQDGNTLTIHTPLIALTKGQIVAQGLELGVDYSLTSTCYDPDTDGNACGTCDACLLRIKGFTENDLQDPIGYQKK